jgi:hypothetical protein
VLSQPGVDLQVIVVDDASQDGSVRLAREIASRDNRVEVIEHERNLGHIATFNDGLARAEGEYALLLSADDQLTPGALVRAADLMDANSAVHLVYGSALEFSDEPPDVPSGPARSWTVWDGDSWLGRRVRSGHNCLRSPEAVVRASVGRELGWYRDDLPHTSDFGMWMQMASLGSVGRINGMPQALYRVHPQSMSRTVFGALIDDLSGRRDAFEVVLGGASGGLPAREDLLAIARRTMAHEALGHAARAVEAGRAESPEVAALLDFARSTFEGYADLPRWRAYQRRISAQGSVPRMRSYGLLSPAREIRARLRWRHWQWTGV